MKALDSKQLLIGIGLKRSEVPSFDHYPFSLPAVRGLHELEFTKPVTFLVGENGSGKSTILEAVAIAWGFNPEGGSKNFRFETRSAHSDLHRYLRIVRGLRRAKTGYFLRAESFFNVASEIERLDEEPGPGPLITPSYGGKSLHAQSHGESFMALLSNRFSPNGFYVLDEPEAALSPSRQLAALVRIHELASAGAQFLIATHSPILMAYPHATILAAGDGKLREVAYEETEHYQVTRQFLLHHQRMLAELLS